MPTAETYLKLFLAYAICSIMTSLFSTTHLSIGIVAQRLEEDLVSEGLVVLQTEDLSETDLPRWVAGQFDVGAEQNEQIRLVHDTLRQLGVDKIHRDVGGREFPLLRHLGQGPCEVYHRVSAILRRDQVELQVAQLVAKVGRRITVPVRRSDRQRWVFTAVIEGKLLNGRLVYPGHVLLQDTYTLMLV